MARNKKCSNFAKRSIYRVSAEEVELYFTCSSKLKVKSAKYQDLTQRSPLSNIPNTAPTILQVDIKPIKTSLSIEILSLSETGHPFSPFSPQYGQIVTCDLAYRIPAQNNKSQINI
jgi:hypothetical protein